MSELLSCRALVVAGGKGLRYGSCKQFSLLLNKPVLWHSVSSLYNCKKIKDITVVVSHENKAIATDITAEFNARIIDVAGSTREQTVKNSLDYFADDEWVLVHDAVRPCLTQTLINRLLAAVGKDGALLAIPVSDALKCVVKMNAIGHIDRSDIWMAQTPQVFPVDRLKKALLAHTDVADEAEAMTRSNYQPQIVMGDKHNIKITYPDDLKLATTFLQR